MYVSLCAYTDCNVGKAGKVGEQGSLVGGECGAVLDLSVVSNTVLHRSR